MENFDKFDRAILAKLNRNARASVNEIADEIALSASAVSRRIQALEKSGVIQSYTTILNGEAIGLAMIIFVEVRLKNLSDKDIDAFENMVAKMSYITDCFLMSGNVDYLLRMRARDMAHFEQIHRNELSRLPGVERLTTRFAMRAVKVAGNQAAAN